LKGNGFTVRAGLDPQNFWLHKSRATFATTCLRGGADIRTVQKWLGHVDLASTMRYLQAARGEAAVALRFNLKIWASCFQQFVAF
jgi:site-specific recombinase XerD